MSEVTKICGLDFALINKAAGTDIQCISRFRDIGSGDSLTFIPDEFDSGPIGSWWSINSGNGAVAYILDGKLNVSGTGGPPPAYSYITQYSFDDEFDLSIKANIDSEPTGSNNSLTAALNVYDEYAGHGYTWVAGISYSTDSNTNDVYISIYAEQESEYDDRVVASGLPLTVQLRVKYAIVVGYLQFFWREVDEDPWTEIVSTATIIPPAGKKAAYLTATIAEDGVSHILSFDYFKTSALL